MRTVGGIIYAKALSKRLAPNPSHNPTEAAITEPKTEAIPFIPQKRGIASLDEGRCLNPVGKGIPINIPNGSTSKTAVETLTIISDD